MYFSWLTICLLAFSISGSAAVLTLTPDNWHEVSRGEWMIKFYAPWCGACRQFASIWSSFERRCRTENMDVQIAEVDVTQYPTLAGRMNLHHLPSVFHVKNNDYREYDGDRGIEAMLAFVKDSGYKKVEPLSYSWHPDNLPMNIFSYVYAFSMQLKAYQDWFVDEKGYSSALFFTALVAVFIGGGLLLGVILVFISFLFESLYARLFGKSKQENGHVNSQPTVASATKAAVNGEQQAEEDETESETATSSDEEQTDAADAQDAGSNARRRNVPRKD